MKLNITFILKADTEEIADTYINWINTNYANFLVEIRKKEHRPESVFPANWAVKCQIQYDGAATTNFRAAFNNILDNHLDKMFHFSANTVFVLSEPEDIE